MPHLILRRKRGEGIENAPALAGQGNRIWCSDLLPLPACGERVGVRGPFRKLELASQSLWKGPLTRNLREERANSDLSIARPSGPAFGGPNGRLRRA